ncbi:MAG: hypothetical protein HYV09_25985 [Deltaproteobacteria bacterium]|nr:hypothetical protein [Deltaproteobacteria bacterium]
MRLASLLAATSITVLACSSDDGAASITAPAPIAWSAPTSDVEIAVIANGASERIVQAFFATGRKTGVSCTSESVAGCEVRTCTKTDDATKGTVLDPGTVTVSSPTIGDAVPLAIDPSNGFGRIIQPGLFPAGEEVRVVATGGSSFPAIDLKVKSPATFEPKSLGGCSQRTTADAPACDLADTAPVATWSGGSRVIVVSLSPTLDLPTITSLHCAFDGATGKGQLPSAALAKLSGDQTYRVSVTGFEDPTTTATAPRTALTSLRIPAKGIAAVRLKK